MTDGPMSGGTGTVRGPAAASPAERSSGAGPAFQPDEQERTVPGSGSWPLRSYLELGALPTAVPRARLHTRRLLREWGLSELAETAELVVSEIVTNAMRASAAMARPHRHAAPPGGVPAVRFWLASDQQQVLIQVWDDSPRKPERQDPGLEAESGRGLLLVEALTADWGSWVPDGWSGKIVWCLVAEAMQVH